MATGPHSRIAAVKDWVGVSAPFILRGDGARQEAGRGAPAWAGGRAQRWPAARLAAVETLWGEGFNAPGGAEEVLRLAAPFALTQGDKLLLVGGGLGGPACAIAASSAAWVANYESDAELAALARARTAAHACGERIVIESWNRHYPDFGVRASDHALALEALRGADPALTLDSLASSLRPGSQIVMTEMVADTQAPGGDREFAAWCRLEDRLPALPSGGAITAALVRLHYDVRVVEDISSAHVSAALAGWRDAVKALGDGPCPAPSAAGVVVTEAELWLLRIRVMRRFGFRLLRWHAVGAARNGAAT
jgi:hypothetical protein